ncbi:helix-turn-helix transcriptional regulator [Agromyces sp. M3QZ16-3]|uniref:helix-turn-helix transcriptional regulator n=1 Tax=Agromyces sp. M3QZ16-3 TaxID=3447585 RepID=UPI003F68D29E
MSGVPTAAMIGREPEMHALRAAYVRSRDGDPSVVVIGGEAGIGKTRLVEEFLRLVDADALVARGQCVELGDDGAPFIPIRAVMRSIVDLAGADAVRTAAGAALDTLAPLLPSEIGGGVPEADLRVGRLHDEFTRMVERVSDLDPVVVVVEDVHWADAPTMQLLRYFARMLHDGRVMLVMTARTAELPRRHRLREDLAELERLRRVSELELPRLSRDEVSRMVATSAAASDAEELFERSGGVPFFVEELLGAGTDGALPRRLSDLLAARYERASAPTRAVLRLMAVGGARAEHDLLEQVYGGDPIDLDAAMREAVEVGLVVADDSGYAFRHALVREVVEAELLPGERARHHATYARVLEAGAARPGLSVEVSTHWLAARRFPEAFDAAVAAMQEASASYALTTAAAMGERCLDLWELVDRPEERAGVDRAGMAGRTARAHRRAGDMERSVALADLRISLADPGDPVERADLMFEKALGMGLMGMPGAADVLLEALGLVADREEARALAVRARVRSELAARRMLAGDLRQAIDQGMLAVADGLAAGEDGRRAASIAANIAATSMADLDDAGPEEVARALELFERAREYAGDDWDARVRLAINRSDTLIKLGRYHDALEVAQEALDEARRRGEEGNVGAILATNAIEPLIALGDWDRARTLVDRALRYETPLVFRLGLEDLKLEPMIWSDALDDAREFMAQIRERHAELARIDRQIEFGWVRDQCELHLALDEPEQAWAAVEPLLWDGRTERPTDRMRLLAFAARAHAAMRRRGLEPSRTTAAIRSAIGEFEAWEPGEAWRELCEAEIADDPAERATRFGRAAELLGSGRGWRHLAGYALVQRAVAELESGDRAAAELSLDAARAAAAEVGAHLVERMAHEVAARGRLTGDRAGGGDELTARERQVLELVADGLSNRQIGERLFISTKTVSVHVSAILRKLGAASRTEAAAIARSHGIARASEAG